MKRKKQGLADDPNPTADPVIGPPESSYDMVNKYGTYNIQDTAATPNANPAIAQGLPRKGKGKKQ
ncbi:MAG: hypothetical protein VB058_01465 [Oscillospiraceae bacterium]|nr:hypothetical protein [Oscillospiraceae bacterium]